MCELCGRPGYRPAGRGGPLYCGSHYGRWYRNGHPEASGRIGQPPHATPGYDAMHARIRARFGKASEYACVDCHKPALHWSYCDCADTEIVNDRGLRYSTDIDDYVPRCASCHKYYDNANPRDTP